MSLKALANKVLERNAERNASGTILFHPPGKTAPENGGGGTRFSSDGTGPKAVLIQTPSGAPELWVQGVADLLAMARPASYPAKGWAAVREDAGRFLLAWAAQANALGWTTYDLFGVHRTHPWARFDCMGLVPLLRGREVAALSETRAAIKVTGGPVHTYRRKSGARSNEACLLWEL